MASADVKFTGSVDESTENIQEILKNASEKAVNEYIKKMMEEVDETDKMKKQREELAKVFSNTFSEEAARPLTNEIITMIQDGEITVDLG